MHNSKETFLGYENMKEYKTSILNYAKNIKSNLDIILDIESYKLREILWNNYYKLKGFGGYNKKYDLLIKEGLLTKESEISKFGLIIKTINLNILNNIKDELVKIGNEQLTFLEKELGENYKYLEKVLKEIDIYKIEDLINILKLLRDNISYDKISNKTELEQFYKNLDLIKKENSGISKKNLGCIKYLFFIKEEELKRYLPYLKEENFYRYGNNLTYLIKNNFNKEKDFGIKKFDIEFSKENNMDPIEACEWFEWYTYDYFKFLNKDFYIVKIDGKIIGHIKDNTIKTFLSYNNILDNNGKIILLKGGIYNFDVGKISDYKKGDGFLGKCTNNNGYRIININKNNSKKIKIRFLRLISNYNYKISSLNFGNSGKMQEENNIWEDFELFIEELSTKLK